MTTKFIVAHVSPSFSETILTLISTDMTKHKLYMEIPEGFREGRDGLVCELLKSIYGIKASRPALVVHVMRLFA